MFDRHRRRWPPVEGRRLNLGVNQSGQDGWVNMDGYVSRPGVVKHDLASIPYPFPDDSFDYIYADHVLEHVQLAFRRWKGVERDVLFDVMEELHRILKAGGLLHVVVPLGGTEMGYSNPQHHRQWRPEWFRMFAQVGREAQAYHRADFRLQRLRFNKSGVRWRTRMLMGKSRTGVTEHLLERLPWLFWWLRPRHEMEAWLVARKGRSPSAARKPARRKRARRGGP